MLTRAYKPPTGPTSMHFVAHRTATGVVVSVDFEKELRNLPEQDHTLEPEFERLCLPLPTSLPWPPGELDLRPAAVPALSVVVPDTLASPTPPFAPYEFTDAASPSAAPVDALTAAVRRFQHGERTDRLLLQAVERHGLKWRKIARHLGGRAAGWTDDVVRNRYIRICNARGTPYTRTIARTPSPKKSMVERWTHADDELLRECVDELGTQWRLVADRFDGTRTQQAIRNRACRMGLTGLDAAVISVDEVEASTAPDALDDLPAADDVLAMVA